MTVGGAVGRLKAAVLSGAAAEMQAAVRAITAAGADPEALEAGLVAAAREVDHGTYERDEAVKISDGLRAAVAACERAWTEAGTPAAGDEAEGMDARLILATLPGDRHGAERHLWRAMLQRRGFEVDDLGVHAPAVIARHAATETVAAVLVPIFDAVVRKAAQSLVLQLQRQGRQTPVLIGGRGVDADFAQWVAVPQGNTPYWGGVYYCEDAAEMLQVLKQIVLYVPPPQAHVHDHDAPEVRADATCTSCAEGCPLSAADCSLLPSQMEGSNDDV